MSEDREARQAQAEELQEEIDRLMRGEEGAIRPSLHELAERKAAEYRASHPPGAARPDQEEPSDQ